jgi:hypothetical protein
MKTYIVLTKENKQGEIYIKIGTTKGNIFEKSNVYLRHNPNIQAFLYKEGDFKDYYSPFEDWYDTRGWIKIDFDSYPNFAQMHIADIIEELMDDEGFKHSYLEYSSMRKPQFDISNPYA